MIFQWHGRVGYYAMPTPFKDKDITTYFESLFAKSDIFRKDGKDDARTLEVLKQKGLAFSLMTSGLRLVDYEECAIGLAKYKYYWIGSGIRAQSTTLCFIETTKIENTAATSGEGLIKESGMMGIGRY